MIGFLSGVIQQIKGSQVIVNVSGVGYLVTVPTKTGFLLGKPAELYIHTHVREDALSLYGFSSSTEVDMFETLISVSGIGPKIAMTLLSSSDVTSISDAIATGNVAFFTAIPGIGKKGAQRLIVELRSKVSSIEVDMNSLDSNSELVEALSGLGYKASEIKSVLQKVNASDPLDLQIRAALSLLKA